MNRSRGFRVALLAALVSSFAPLASSRTAPDVGTPFDGCGTIVMGVECALFNSDNGGLYILYSSTPYQIGDYLHVVGVIEAGCLSFCQQGNGCIDATVVEPCSPATVLCFGDGSSGDCPCGNNGASGHGCDNSAGTGGAQLTAIGTTNPDTVVLICTDELPSTLSIFFQGDGGLDVPLFSGDGLRCVSGNLIRLYVKNASSGTAIAPQDGDPSITQQSANQGDPLSSGALRHYQVFYRDPVESFCGNPPGNTWNLSSAISIGW